MGKIIGESFDPYVAKQIEVRQKKLGAENRDPDVLAYTTSKTSWLRLTSGVDVDETKLSELGRPNQGLEKNKLAESYVLFGGANNVSKSSMPKGGFLDSYSNSLSQNASYGFNSKKEYGIVPLPGIESAEIIPKNRGSLREANIIIKAFNREQFDIIETLYMRLKYSILLEWGHTMYFDNKRTFQTILKDQVYKKFLTKSSISKERILELIQLQRKESNGNYDGFLGWVTNFSWDLSSEGIYTINLRAISYGDIIESLSITKPISLQPNEEKENETPVGSPLEILFNKFKKLLNNELNNDFVKNIVTVNKYEAETTLGRDDQGGVNGTYINGGELSEFAIAKILNSEINHYTPSFNPKTSKELAMLDVRDIGWSQLFSPDDNSLYYIKLGSLLRIIQNFFSIYDSSKSNNDPLFFIDYDYNNTFCSTVPNLFTSDPSICVIPSNYQEYYSDANANKTVYFSNPQLRNAKIASFKEINEFFGDNFLTSNKYEAKPLHIHVNIDFIISQLKINIDENGDLSLFDFLSSILKGINSSLSGVLNLGIFYDEEINTYSIIDNNPPIKPFTETTSPDPTKINVKGLRNNIGSFVLNMSIKSEISSKLSNQLAIGAQANNSNLGSNSFSISNWNKGLTDRLILEKTSNTPPPPPIDTPTSETTNNELNLDYLEVLRYVVKFQKGANFGSNGIDKYKSYITNYFKVERDQAVRSNNLSSKFFIPISLNLELDGISGIKLFQKYTINDEILPKNYRNNIEFLTKGLRHSIDQSGWTTSIEGLSIPKQK
jgi:hypothetical protein